ncbi:MAG: UMP kinase [Euryarchaeota archaeon]|nr:UMP kinase [Euryarchaeota archaeon]
MSPTYVVALGGSLLRPEEEEHRQTWFGQLRQLGVHMEGIGAHLGLVVGGGLPAREGINLAKPFIADERALDEIGIAATRINATIIQQIFLDIGIDVAPTIPHDCKSAAELLQNHSIVVMGGTVPGHTTDAVAVEFATTAKASQCIIATNVSHVYDKDPRTNDDAEAKTNLTLSELGEICGVGTPLEAGANAVVDPVAVARAIDANLTLAVLDGRNLALLDAALDGKEFTGTLIVPETQNPL